jgi:hypothetical protein
MVRIWLEDVSLPSLDIFNLPCFMTNTYAPNPKRNNSEPAPDIIHQIAMTSAMIISIAFIKSIIMKN